MSLKKSLGFWKILYGHVIQLSFVISVGMSSCALTSAQVHDDESVEHGSEFTLGNLTHGRANGSEINSSLNETDWADGNWRRNDHSRIAAIAVYGSVILIAIFGILVKYFVTQYETLQAKAQLEYQQLRNVQIQ